MVKTITPFSSRAKEGATDSPLGDFVNVDQSIVSTANVGFYDENTGKLTGVKASDKVFGNIQLDSGIANGVAIITPSKNTDGTWPLDMTGYNDIFYAIKPTNGGNYSAEAIMGPDDISFGGLSPVNAAASLKIATDGEPSDEGLYSVLWDAVESLGVDVWNIFQIQGRCKDQKVLQFRFTNNSGGSSDIQTAFMRLV